MIVLEKESPTISLVTVCLACDFKMENQREKNTAQNYLIPNLT